MFLPPRTATTASGVVGAARPSSAARGRGRMAGPRPIYGVDYVPWSYCCKPGGISGRSARLLQGSRHRERP